MKDFRSASLADQVFEKLEYDIISGVYTRGEILTELKLVEQLGVSRTPIREALRRLEQERLIADTGKGSQVLGITEEDLLDIMNIRESVEGLATYYATLNITPQGLDELKHIIELQEFYLNKNDSEHLRQNDDRFHNLICELSKRTVIKDTLLPLHRKTQRYRKASIEKPGRIVNVVKEHREIYEAIASGNAQKAAELTSRHIENAKNNMLEGMKNHG